MNLAEKQGLPLTGDEEGVRYLSVQLVLSWDEQRTGLAKGLANQKHNLESGVSETQGEGHRGVFSESSGGHERKSSWASRPAGLVGDKDVSAARYGTKRKGYSGDGGYRSRPKPLFSSWQFCKPTKYLPAYVSVVNNLPATATGSSVLGWGRSPGGGNGNPLQYSCLENLHGQRSLASYRPWVRKEQTWLSMHVPQRVSITFKINFSYGSLCTQNQLEA